MKKINPKLLYESIGDADEALLAECEDAVKQDRAAFRPMGKILRPAAVAACVCVLAGALIALPFLKDVSAPRDGDDQGVAQKTPSSHENDELAKVPTWEESDAVQRFPEVSFADTVYTGHSAPLPEEKVGEPLGETVLTGYDEYEDRSYKANAALCRIDGVEPVCAVAVKIAGETSAFPYTNSKYAPATLGQMIRDLSLADTLTFGPVSGENDATVYRFRGSGDGTADAKAESTPAKALWQLLLSSADAKAVESSPDASPVCSVSVSLPLLGYGNLSLAIYENGYLWTNLLDSEKIFFVGKAPVETFLADLHAHYEEIPYSPPPVSDEPIPE